ncbi:MAG: GNAT family N-acetyltransferase, partial [Methylococcaceae bacterium]|nr:GNAT family N-acetyltransferase [Methylococcaceae bacterium]
MINAERLLQETYPHFKWGKNNKLLLKVLKKLIHQEDFNEVIQKNQHLRGFAFLDKLLHYFKFTYQVGNNSFN